MQDGNHNKSIRATVRKVAPAPPTPPTAGPANENVAELAGEEQEQEAREGRHLAEAFAGSSGGELERLGHIVDLLPCYVILVDKEQRVFFHNKAFEEFFGKDAATQPSGLPLLPPADGGPPVLEWTHPATRNTFRTHYYPFQEIGGEHRALSVGFNITTSVRMQQALDLSERSYRIITDSLSIGIALLTPNLAVWDANNRLTQWFGQDVTKAKDICTVLRCPSRARAESDSQCQECPFVLALQDGNTHETEFPITFPDGKERVARLAVSPVRSRSGPVRALIMMLEDISNRLLVNRQLQRARKMEAMSALAAGIAHEINQPLSALHLYASGLQMLLEKSEPPPTDVTQERLFLIMREAGRIRSIISHMRALVMQKGSVPVGAVSVRQVIAGALELMRQQLEKRNIMVEVQLPAYLPLVRSNAIQLEQVIINLLANAMHALDSMAARREIKGDQRVRISATILDGGAKVRLWVADSGPGLPEGKEQIFDPFFTTKEQHEGMGLGLSIVYGLVKLWGGGVGAISKHPELGGAAFFVDLYATTPEEEERAMASDEQTDQPSPISIDADGE